MKLLDLFCGMGGWSIGFHREGFECHGLDIVDVGYPYNFWQGDVMDIYSAVYQPIFQNVDVVVAGPPCVEFSHLTTLSWKKGQRGPPNPKKGMKLVRRTKEIIDTLKPRFWAVENVQGAVEHFKPLFGDPVLDAKPWYLWGNFPMPDLPKVDRLKGIHRETKRGNALGLPEDFPFDPLRSWRRARFPLFLSMAIARACKEKIIT